LSYLSTRRAFIAGGIAASISAVRYSPAFAAAPSRPKRAGFRALTLHEAAALNVLGDALVPGSSRHGLVRYVDHQLSGPVDESMLMIKYLNVTQPFHAFYSSGLRAASALAMHRFHQPIDSLKHAQAAALVQALAKGQLEDWDGPPPPLFYFVIKADAVDATYGTPEGFKSLGVPYMAHIAPPTPWGK
jgi:Gluconate 2-dehydrogenase subunit 3